MQNMMKRVCRFVVTNPTFGKCRLHTSSGLYFMELPKSGYPIKHDRDPPKDVSLIRNVLDGYRKFVHELSLYRKELKQNYIDGPEYVPEPNKTYIAWKFDGTQESLDRWVVTCDSDYNEGFSTAKLELSPNSGTGIFSGVLSTQVPKDGKIVKAGYCNITTVPNRISFYREVPLDWNLYNHLVLRIRGDGRCYMLNIRAGANVDLQWNDLYSYVMYTRGGPLWQTVRIPFSRFVFSSKGCVQDRQTCNLNEVSSSVLKFSITLADKVQGPFKLEIESIGVMWAPFHFEDEAYESYSVKDIKGF